MAAKGANASLAESLMEAAQAITRAMGSPEAISPQIQQGLGKLQQVVLGMARGGPPQGQPGQPPGATPPGVPGAGMGPPGGGAANPTMPALTGGQLPPTPPGAGATSAIPQPSSDELRRMLAQGAA